MIALGVKHAERIDAALRPSLAGPRRPDLEAFFAEDVPEPFFVKNLERVQGDERDAIIISVGYGKHPDGRMRYQWGPLLRDGGERRLNVAATRARRRLTAVSSFSSHDVDPSRLTPPVPACSRSTWSTPAPAASPSRRCQVSSGGYAHGAGQSPEASAAGYATDGQSDAGEFHADVAARLAELGITVVPQYGVGGYRVDFAAAHPDDPSRMILPSRPTAPGTAIPAACVTGTACARSTWSAWAGASTACGPPRGSPTRRENWPSSGPPSTPRSARHRRHRRSPRPRPSPVPRPGPKPAGPDRDRA